MNVLDENVADDQRELLRSRHVAVRHIGFDLGRSGMKDNEIIPLLLQLKRPTFFTLDIDFYKRRLCHARYCLVYLDIPEQAVANYVIRLLRHRAFRTRAKRLGCVVRVSVRGLTYWRIRVEKRHSLAW